MQPKRGLFVTGTDTDVGKTYITAMIARQLVAEGQRVAVYKPVASGCENVNGTLVSEDATTLWEATGRHGALDSVCPQRFAAPLSPHRAAQQDGKQVDEEQLRVGLTAAASDCDVVLIEGAGGLLSPISADEFNADLAFDFGYPMIVVAANGLGVINQTLQTLVTAETFREGIGVAGVILNDRHDCSDLSCRTNAEDLRDRSVPPLLAEVAFASKSISPRVDWLTIAEGL